MLQKQVARRVGLLPGGGFASCWGLGRLFGGLLQPWRLRGRDSQTLFVENSGRILRLSENFVGMPEEFFLGLATTDMHACGASSTARSPTRAKGSSAGAYQGKPPSPHHRKPGALPPNRVRKMVLQGPHDVFGELPKGGHLRIRRP